MASPENIPTAAEATSEQIEAALRRAVDDAREAHRRVGQSMVIWRSGRVVWVDPVTLEEVVPPDSEKTPAQCVEVGS